MRKIIFVMLVALSSVKAYSQCGNVTAKEIEDGYKKQYTVAMKDSSLEASNLMLWGDEKGLLSKVSYFDLRTNIQKCGKMVLPPSMFLLSEDSKSGESHLYWLGPIAGQNTKENEAIWKTLSKKYGVVKIANNRDSLNSKMFEAVPAIWAKMDTIYSINNPILYGGNWITTPKKCDLIMVDEVDLLHSTGMDIVRENGSLKGDIIKIICSTEENTKIMKHGSGSMKRDSEMELNLFARDINRLLPNKKASRINKKYDLALLIDSLGCSHLMPLSTSNFDEQDKALMADLSDAIEKNSIDTFGRFITFDGRIFGARYLQAYFRRGKWVFNDYMWLDNRNTDESVKDSSAKRVTYPLRDVK